MPMVLQHIDKICREKQRDVLYIGFDVDILNGERPDDLKVRNNIMEWLDKHNVSYVECDGIASDGSMSTFYKGEIYIDVIFDENNEDYKKIVAFLENDDGSMRLPKVTFYRLPLEVAQKNKHHDEPGYWNSW